MLSLFFYWFATCLPRLALQILIRQRGCSQGVLWRVEAEALMEVEEVRQGQLCAAANAQPPARASCSPVATWLWIACDTAKGLFFSLPWPWI